MNHGSQIAGISDASFISRNKYPVRCPLSSVKYAASGFSSARISLMVAPSLPARAALFPASTGMFIFSMKRMVLPPMIGCRASLCDNCKNDDRRKVFEGLLEFKQRAESQSGASSRPPNMDGLYKRMSD